MKTLLVNLFAGPGAGKSTLCAGLFANLKMRGVSCEMAREVVKDYAWRGEPTPPQDEVWVAQLKTEAQYMGKVRVVVTDSPPVLSAVYGDLSDDHRLVIKMFHRNYSDIAKELGVNVDVMDVQVVRTKPYDPAGRYQTRDQAESLDDEIADLIGKFDLVVTGDAEGLQALTEEVLYRLEQDDTQQVSGE